MPVTRGSLKRALGPLDVSSLKVVERSKTLRKRDIETINLDQETPPFKRSRSAVATGKGGTPSHHVHSKESNKERKSISTIKAGGKSDGIQICKQIGTKGPTWVWETKWWQKGMTRVAGVDEAGRGPLAGPVVAAACIIPRGAEVPAGIHDSKQLTEAQREKVYDELISNPQIECSTCVLGPEEIDRVNILQATMLAMTAAIKSLAKGKPDAILIDGNRVPCELQCPTSESVVKGDSKCISVAAASILAKVLC